MSDIRLLGAGDEGRLAAFFEAAPDHTMIQRSNLGRGGAGWTGGRHSGLFAACFDGGRITGVIAHYGSGLIAPLVEHVASDFRQLLDALLAASPLPVKVVMGGCDQVAAALRHPRIAGRPVLSCDREILYALPLDGLRVPPSLSHGGIAVRAVTDDDVPLLTAWRVEYLVECFRVARGGATLDEAAHEVGGAIADRRGWVVEADGRPLAYTGFNAVLPDAVQVGGVYTLPFARARGLARTAVAGSLLRAREFGARRAVLFTDVDNVAAQRAYAALGFAAIGDWGIARFGDG